MPDYQLLTHEHRDLVNGYLQRFAPEISEHTFTNLYVWRQARPIWLTVVLDSLIFVIERRHGAKTTRVLFGPPLGSATPLEVITALPDELTGVVRIPEPGATQLTAAGVHPIPDRANADYVYRVADLTALAGRNYHKKRNHVNQCLAKYQCSYEPISATNLEECKTTQRRWCEHRLCRTHPGLGNEDVAIAEMFDHLLPWQLIGGAVRLNGTIQAYAVGERLNPTTAVCHFEKAMPNFDGLGQLINHWFAKYSLTGFEFVNREQDLGIAGLRQAKESYCPDHMVDKFSWFADR